MTILAFGINHKSAAVDVRERINFSAEKLGGALRHLVDYGDVSEAAILSTCHRTELYCGSAEKDKIIRWLGDYHQVPANLIMACGYTHYDVSAVNHMMRVASGLDSMILGEPQILGQMKQAYAHASEAGTIGKRLGRLFQTTFAVAKRVRTDTKIGHNPVSVASAAVKLVDHIFSDWQKTTVLFVGAGETIELAAKHVQRQQAEHLIFANRTLSKAQTLAKYYQGHAIKLDDIPDYLARADVTITATGSALPLIGKGSVEQALKWRKHKPMLMIDLSVPRDIEPQVTQLDDVYLYTVDNLHQVVADNVNVRMHAAREAEGIIEYHADKFMGWVHSLEHVNIMQDFRAINDNLRDIELNKALQALANGKEPSMIMRQLAHGLTQKILHRPTQAVQQAIRNGQQDELQAARKILLGDEQE